MMAQQFSDAGIVSLPPAAVASTSESSKIAAAAAAIDDYDQDDEAENDELGNYPAKKISLEIKGDTKSSKENENPEKAQQMSNLIGKIKPANLESIIAKKSSTNKIFKLNEVTLNNIDQFNATSMQSLLNQANARILTAEGSLFIKTYLFYFAINISRYLTEFFILILFKETVPKFCKDANLLRKKIIIDMAKLEDYETSSFFFMFDYFFKVQYLFNEKKIFF